MIKKMVILGCAVLMFSCSSGKKVYTSGVNPAEVQQIVYLTPYFKESTAKYDEAQKRLVIRTNRIMDSVILKNKVNYRSSQQTIANPPTQNIQQELKVLWEQLENSEEINKIPVPSSIKKLLDEKNQRFAFVMLLDPQYTTWGAKLSRRQSSATGDLNTIIVDYIDITGVLFDNEKNNIALYKQPDSKHYLGYEAELRYALEEIILNFLQQ